MNKKVFHKRGMQPQREVFRNPEGKIYSEYGETIMALYIEDKLTIADIARLYGCAENTMGRYIRRHLQDWLGGEETEYRAHCRACAGVLDRLINDDGLVWSYAEMARENGTSARVAAAIAIRNGFRRRKKCRRQ